MSRRIVRRWRELTGGSGTRDADRRTVLACSGGADSGAMALALAATGRVVLGHVLHDMRPEDEVRADRDAVRALAEELGVGYCEGRACVRGEPGNAEGVARDGRYAALEQMAQAEGCRFIATAHHADDQLETVIMRVIRGSGPRGLGGISETRRLGSATVIRPMLGVSRADCERLCTDAGWVWCEDRTNDDQDLVRNAIRARVTPVLRQIRRDAATRASATALVCGMTADAIESMARRLANRASRRVDDAEHRICLDRDVLASGPIAVRCEVMRMVVRDRGRGGLDRLGWTVLEPVARAIGDANREPRVFRAGPIVVRVVSHRVWIEDAQKETNDADA